VTEALPRAATRMGAAAAISRVFGAVRVAVIAAVLGTTALGDAFQSANSVPNVLFDLLAAGALSAVLVPAFVEHLTREDTDAAQEVAGGVLSLAVCAMSVVAVVGIAAAPLLADLLTAAVDDPAVAAEQQELVTFLLRLFLPQVVLYAIGTVATAVHNAGGSFVIPAAAPIGNTIVVVAALLVFRAMAGPDPGLDLTTAEQLVLGLGGTLGVAAFVGLPALTLRARGFRMPFHPVRAWRDGRVRRLLHLSGWAVLQHAAAGLLLLTAIVVGGGVAGGVVAYQFAFVVFLTPYGVLAQPILTTTHTAMSRHAAASEPGRLGDDLRWAVDAIATVILPVTAGLCALALPIMSVLAFGNATDGDGVELLAAALAWLAVGLLPYSACMLLARAWYALGDSRTPGIAVAVASAVGAAAMVVGGMAVDGPGRLAVLGGAHSGAYLLAAGWLAARIRPRTGPVLTRRILLPVTLSAVLGVAAWAAISAWNPAGRLGTIVALGVVSAAGGAAYLLAVRFLRSEPPPAGAA
jgi:putative peptidoglycan lipid II flippase